MRNHMIIQIDAEKNNNVQNLFMIKTLSKLGRRNFVKVIKNIYRNPTANITLKDKKTKVFC